MLNIGPQELLLILVVALLVVGPQRLPELSRQIGRGLREFRKIQDDVRGMVDLDEVKGMARFDADASTGSERVAKPPASPGVHRASRPAPVADDGGTSGNATVRSVDDAAPTEPPSAD
jgi:Tat protein translocase TatB subunit